MLLNSFIQERYKWTNMKSIKDENSYVGFLPGSWSWAWDLLLLYLLACSDLEVLLLVLLLSLELVPAWLCCWFTTPYLGQAVWKCQISGKQDTTFTQILPQFLCSWQIGCWHWCWLLNALRSNFGCAKFGSSTKLFLLHMLFGIIMRI